MPDPATIYDVITATWPAAQTRQIGPVTIRQGLGGGSRVSAATADRTLSQEELEAAEDGMRAWGQLPTFVIRDGDAALDRQLDSAGYVVHDRALQYMCDIDILANKRPSKVSTFICPKALSIQRDIWAAGGIGPTRMAIMDRAKGPKATILGRMDDQPAGTLFVALHRSIAMVHAVEVHKDHRRKGLAKYMMTAAAFWARDNGAKTMALMTTAANNAANPLYASLRMDVVGSYHYRKLPE